MHVHTHTHNGSSSSETKPIETDIVTTKKLLRFLRCAYYYFIRKQTQHTHTQTGTNTHTYGNTVAADAHSDYACDNSDSAASTTPSGSRERESMRERQKFTLAALLAAGNATRRRTLSLCRSLRSNCVRVAAAAAVTVICCWPVCLCRSCVSLRYTNTNTNANARQSGQQWQQQRHRHRQRRQQQRRQRRPFVCIFLLSVV